jgi:hypothetical protein
LHKAGQAKVQERQNSFIIVILDDSQKYSYDLLVFSRVFAKKHKKANLKQKIVVC